MFACCAPGRAFQNNSETIRLLILLMAATIWILSANAAAAEDAEKPPAVKNEKITPLSVVKFSAGMVSAFMVHEAAHELVANATGNSLSWDPGTLNQPIQFREDADSSTDAMYINAAGLTAQLVGTEIILDVDKINKDDAFVRGMVAWNILNPISYALDYWFINRTNKKKTNGYEGDLQGIEYHKGEDTANVFAASIVAVSLVHGYRFIKTQDWAPDWIKPKDNGHTSTVTVQPRRQGVELTYHTTF